MTIKNFKKLVIFTMKFVYVESSEKIAYSQKCI